MWPYLASFAYWWSMLPTELPYLFFILRQACMLGTDSLIDSPTKPIWKPGLGCPNRVVNSLMSLYPASAIPISMTLVTPDRLGHLSHLLHISKLKHMKHLSSDEYFLLQISHFWHLLHLWSYWYFLHFGHLLRNLKHLYTCDSCDICHPYYMLKIIYILLRVGHVWHVTLLRQVSCGKC